MISFKLRNILFFLFILYAAVLQAQNNLPQLSNELAKDFTTKDTLFKEPFVDVDEWRDKPVRHRYVHGGFKGNNTRFSFYFPPKENYEDVFSNTLPHSQIMKIYRRECPVQKTKSGFP